MTRKQRKPIEIDNYVYEDRRDLQEMPRDLNNTLPIKYRGPKPPAHKMYEYRDGDVVSEVVPDTSTYRKFYIKFGDRWRGFDCGREY